MKSVMKMVGMFKHQEKVKTRMCVCVFLQKSPMRSKYHVPMVSPYLYLSIDSYRYKSLFGVPGRKISFGK